jgi:hypothetical protein
MCYRAGWRYLPKNIKGITRFRDKLNLLNFVAATRLVDWGFGGVMTSRSAIMWGLTQYQRWWQRLKSWLMIVWI